MVKAKKTSKTKRIFAQIFLIINLLAVFTAALNACENIEHKLVPYYDTIEIFK